MHVPACPLAGPEGRPVPWGMAQRFSLRGLGFGVALSAAALVGACGGSNTTGGPSGTGGVAGTGGGSGGHGLGGSTFVGSGGMQAFDVQPSTLQTVTVTLGQTSPTVNYTATLAGLPVNVGWS